MSLGHRAMCTVRETSNYLLKITDQQLDPVECINFVHGSKAGGNFLFIGTTRDTEGETSIAGLQYEVYEDMAMELMEKITMEVLMKYSDVIKVAIIHRKGWVPVSNASFMAAVSGGHRCDPHSAVLYIVNQVKARVPIWKKIIYQSKIGEESGQKDDKRDDKKDDKNDQLHHQVKDGQESSAYHLMLKKCCNQSGQNVTDEHLMGQGKLLLNNNNNLPPSSSILEKIPSNCPKCPSSVSAQPDTPLNHWSTSSEAFWKTIK